MTFTVRRYGKKADDMNIKKIPNILCLIRICLIPFILLFLLENPLVSKIPATVRILTAGLLYAAAMLTDLFDGKIARKYDAVTDFGKFIDPIADKMLVLSILLAFVDMKLISAVPVILVLAREFLVTGLRLAAMNKGTVVAANIWGKAKTMTQAILIGISFLSMLAACILGDGSITAYLLNLPGLLAWITAAVTVISGITYAIECKEFIKL